MPEKQPFVPLCISFLYGVRTLTLSKQTRLICPQMLILCGLMQKMPIRLRRRWAYTIPAVMAAGSAGGTVMVIMSRDSIMMVFAGTWNRRKSKKNISFSASLTITLIISLVVLPDARAFKVLWITKTPDNISQNEEQK